MTRRPALAVLAVGLLAVGLPAPGAPAAGPDFAAMQIQPYDPPKPAPDFALPDIEGRTVRLERLRGKAVLLVDFREDPGLVRRTVRARGYAAPVLLDESGEVTGRLYGVWGPPTVYVVDRTGRLVGRAVGPRRWDGPATRDLLLALLDAPAKP